MKQVRSRGSALLRRAGTAQFLRFCVVGGVGFCVDAGVLLAVMHGAGFNAITGRLISFTVAVLTTFELNRLWAFGPPAGRSYLTILAAYLGVQGIGFACSLSLYAILYVALPTPFNAPLICLGIASALALVVNYTGAKMIVFRGRAKARDSV